MTKFLRFTFFVLSISVSFAVLAGQQTANMQITASVAASCSVSSAGADFGEVTPFAGDTASGTIDVNCSAGAPYTVSLDAGLNPQDGGAVRSMVSGTAPIRYQILKGAGTGGAGSDWGDAGTGGTFPSATPATGVGTGSVQNLGFNLAVAFEGSNTYTPGGSYSDTVQITVDF